MSKGGLLVAIFSVCLIALFVALVYLISNINPAARPESLKYDDADYILSPNEVLLLNSNIGYGLEKVIGEYNDDQPRKTITRTKSTHNNTDIADLSPNENQTKNVREHNISVFETVTEPMKAVKGLRRSINEKNRQEHDKETPKSMLFKIKKIYGQPRIEIKLITEKLKSKTNRKYRSSGTKIKSSTINVELDSNTSEASIITVENGTFILNIFANSVDVIRENDALSYELENNNTENVLDYYNSQEIETPIPKLEFPIENPIPNINKEKHKMFVIDSNLTADLENLKEIDVTNMNTFQLISNLTMSSITLAQNTTEKLLMSP